MLHKCYENITIMLRKKKKNKNYYQSKEFKKLYWLKKKAELEFSEFVRNY